MHSLTVSFGYRFLTALVLSTVCMFGLALGQDDTLEFRAWEDSSGKSKIEAALIVVKEGTVYLERKDGRIIGVPLDRLSDADQKFALADSAGLPAENSDARIPRQIDAAEPQKAGDPRTALAIAQRETNGSWYSYPALVTKIKGEVGYVMASPSVAYVQRGQSKPTPYRVVIHPGTEKQRTIDAELASDDRRQGVAFLRVSSEGLPAPPALADNEIQQGGVFSAYGLSSFRDDAQVSFRKVTVETVRSSEAGDLLSVELTGQGIDQLQGSVVVDEKLSVVGFAQAVRSRGGRGTPTNKATMTTSRQIARMWTPSLSQLKAEPTAWDSKGVSVHLEGIVSDPMGRVEKMVLAIKRIVGEPPKIESRGGVWPRAAEDMTYVKVELGERGIVRPRDGLTWRDGSAVPSDGSLRYMAQLATSTNDGEVVYSRPLIVIPNFLGRHWGESYSLFRAAGENARPHPAGGIVLTSETSQAAAVELPAAENNGDFPTPIVEDGIFLKENLQVERALSRGYLGTRNKLGMWADGGAAFLYGDQGTKIVRRLSVPDFKAQWELAFDANIVGMALAKDRLLVLTTMGEKPGSLWGLDPKTGKVLWRREAIRGELAASPSGSLAVMTQIPRDSSSLMLLDTASGKPLHVIKGFSFRMPLGNFKFSTDGKHLIAQCEKSLVRFRFEGGHLILEDASAQIEPYEPALSADGKILFAKVDGRRARRDGHADFSRGMYFYNPRSLTKPVMSFPLNKTNPYALTLGLASRRLFTIQPDSTRRRRGLDIYSLEGELLHHMENVEADILYIHPDNKRLLGNYNDQFAWIDLPEHVHRSGGGLATEEDPEALTGRLINLLGWKVEALNEQPSQKEFIPLEGGGRATKIPLSVPNGTGLVWSEDGRFIFFRQGSRVWRYSIDECRSTHQLMLSSQRGSGTHFSNRLAICPQGLLVRHDKRLVLVDSETLLPRRLVLDDIGHGNLYFASPKIPHLIRIEYVHEQRLSFSSVDIESGKAIDQWTIPFEESQKRALGAGNFSELSPDGKHLFCGGRPAVHVAFDATGNITGKHDVAMLAENSTTIPFRMNSSEAVAFRQSSSRGVRSFICDIDDTSKAVVASDVELPWFYDAPTKLYWQVDRTGKIVGYDAEGKEQAALTADEGMNGLRGLNPYSLATAPPGGGRLLLNSGGPWWVELPEPK